MRSPENKFNNWIIKQNIEVSAYILRQTISLRYEIDNRKCTVYNEVYGKSELKEYYVYWKRNINPQINI